MSQAREVMDRATGAIMHHRLDEYVAYLAPEVEAETPDAGTLHGRDELREWMREFLDAFPDLEYEPIHAYEDGNVAIDEGIVKGTNTGPIALPDGQTLPPTGKPLRLRAVDIATVEDGKITHHNFYFDQVDFANQLGLPV